MKRKHIGVAILFMASFSSLCQAKLKLPHVLSDHMVLQRGKVVQIWGEALPDEKVTVQFDGQRVDVKAGPKGNWLAKLSPMKAKTKPSTLVVSTKAGETIKLKDILVGEVWVGSGQSNMDITFARLKLPVNLLAKATNPQIRFFKVPHIYALTSQDDVTGKWKACTQKTARNFSAVLYYFGRDLQAKLGVPIGLIQSAWGGSRIEPWIAPQGYKLIPHFKEILAKEKKKLKFSRDAQVENLDQYEAWLKNARIASEAGQSVPWPPRWRGDNKHQFMTRTYNAMIHPLLALRFRGVVWYQGESNRGDRNRAGYLDLMKALVKGWREAFNQGEFPFYFVQLASFGYGGSPLALAELRDAQLKSMQQIPHAGMVVTTDVSTIKNIHPKNKQAVGKRLALWALAKDYGYKKIVYSGPIYDHAKVQGKTIRLYFKHIGKGLVSRDGKPLTWFMIADKNKHFVKATAVIDGDTVVVQSPNIAFPAFVRFGWYQTAEPNLANREGLPASPFRTGP